MAKRHRRTPAAAPTAPPSAPAPRPDALLGAPVLAEGEDPAAFEAVERDLADSIVPADAMEWLWVRDMADLEWQARRLRLTRAAIVEAAARRGDGATPSVEERRRKLEDFQVRIQAALAGQPGSGWPGPLSPPPSEQELTEAHRRLMAEVAQLDRMILGLDARRNAILLTLEARRRLRHGSGR